MERSTDVRSQQQDELDTAVTRQDFLNALEKVGRSVSDQDLVRYAEWMETFGSS